MRKTAIVTGSTSGIGLGIAEALAGAGMNVMLNGFGEACEIEAHRRRIAGRSGSEVGYNAADMSKPDAIASLVEETRERFGRIDIVVNNAGVQTVAPIEDFPRERWDLIIAVNLSAAFHLVRLTFAEMKDRGWGRVINVASAHALVASPFKSAYVAAKHGILGLTKTVALEGAEHGVTCNAICPGYVLTPLVEKQIPETAKARGISEEAVVRDVLLAAQPTRAFVEVGQLGALAAFLCSDAAAQITGTALPVDGGWTAH
ncbi:3-hydroxybutyrate dehydrogenase [Acuticoccus kandeliae]|uniref:3-hydroxybutyrate dehydrogenase n=1 Tax=Acuticoccus kandeliae TaxID=2073160 RepID=UPI000D3ECADC|nr:3-hydroxybutyrate dehydrogenase [Acuticoccus kandeliae]